jgi:hypothetical protein|tara:strand:+ start:2598 stop:3881 length:1284 start_codon:yes stop_codon:yes gene_type:complete
MANIGFGLQTDKNASERGYDLFQTSLGETLSTTALDAWKYNPVSSIWRLAELEGNRNKDDDEPLINRRVLNEKYKNLGLFFEQDEKQSTVEILVERKKQEQERQSVINRGPKGVAVGAAKLATSFVASALDPINLVAAFIPIVGQSNFARLVAKYGFTRARLAKGAIEGTVGTALFEPIVYTAAQREQSQYDLVDSFLAVSFGTVLGGGLHVGAGKLKDFRRRRKFEKKVKDAREKAGITDGETPEWNPYKEYYGENARIMKELAETAPETRAALLQRALTDLIEDNPVNVKPMADLDPKLRNAQINQNVPKKERVNVNQKDDNIQGIDRRVTDENSGNTILKNPDQRELNNFETSGRTKSLESKNLDQENVNLESQLNIIKDRQKGLGIEDSAEIQTSKKAVDEFNQKNKEIKDAIKDGINCVTKR